MKTHVESTHPKLVACRKLAITKELVTVASHNQQSGKKWSRPFGCVITSYFGATTFIRSLMKHNNSFLKT